MSTEVVLNPGCKVPEKPIMIEGFPSKGFVSTIAARYMIDEMNMQPIGYIESDKLRSVAVIHDSKPMRPIRIYAKDSFVVILSEVIIPIGHVPDISSALIKWIKDISPDKVVLLAGISGKDTEKDHEIFGLTNVDELTLKMKSLKISTVEEGMLTGISSELLLHCVENNISWISLMAETKNLPDPLAAASMLDLLKKLLDLKVDLKKLNEEGQKIEAMYKELSDQMRRGKEGIREMENYSPMYC